MDCTRAGTRSGSSINGKPAETSRSATPFEAYTLVITPQHGPCKIVAIGHTIETSVYGTELSSKFESIEEAFRIESPDRGHRGYLARSSSLMRDCLQRSLRALRRCR